MAHNDLTVEQLLEEVKKELKEVNKKLDILIGHEEAEEAELDELEERKES